MATHVMPKRDLTAPPTVASPRENDWTKPAAMAIPKRSPNPGVLRLLDHREDHPGKRADLL